MRVHYRVTSSTNDRARELAERGAPEFTVVTANEQTAGRGRQGRSWVAEPGDALLMSVVLHSFDGLLPLRAGLAVAELAGEKALVKWPNDVLVQERKLAGVLVEARPGSWAVCGIGVNVRGAPVGVAAAHLSRVGIEGVLSELLVVLRRWLSEPPSSLLAALRARDALLGQPVTWADGSGVGAGIAEDGSLRVAVDSGGEVVLRAGEVHLGG